MPLCVAGMHRSGTSMVARLLGCCGLYLGPEADLLPPAPNNPEGFWESRSFLRLNDAILKARGGSWHRPPQAEVAGWEDDPGLDRLYREADRLVRRFRGREPWGWKDPRNCLTLPLWRKVLPDLRILVCVRNPLSVAESLQARDGMSVAESLDLWLTYNRRLLAAAPPERRVITHCESYFLDPDGELRRVLHSLDMETNEESLARACERINLSLVHHRITMDELTASGAPDDVVACYLTLWDEAESVNSEQRVRSAGDGAQQPFAGAPGSW